MSPRQGTNIYFRQKKKGYIMIIDFSHTIDSYDEIMGIYGNLGYTCPKCKGNRLIRYASYNRSVLSFERDSLECRMVRILRLRCKNCGSTHAVLTADMVPFWASSLPCDKGRLAIVRFIMNSRLPYTEKSARPESE